MKNKQYYVSGFLIIILIVVVLMKNKNTSCQATQHIGMLIRQTARWAVASQQDTSPMIALLHANYAAGYLQALELVATEQEINQFTSLQKLRNKVYGTQDKAVRQVVASCPNYLGEKIDKELARMGMTGS